MFNFPEGKITFMGTAVEGGLMTNCLGNDEDDEPPTPSSSSRRNAIFEALNDEVSHGPK